jgi:glutathione S-transferase
MSQRIVFYTNPMSRGRIVRWMLEEVGQPYETVLLDYGTSMKAPDYLAINPMGKVPAIKHGEVVVTEAAAICAYLADAFPSAGLAPPVNDPRRGAYYRWLFFAAGPVEGAAVNQALGVVVPAERARLTGYGTLQHVLDALEGAVRQGPYLLGDQFTAADVYLGSQIGWGTRMGSLEMRPAFQPYLERILMRPAAIRARSIDDAQAATPPPAPTPGVTARS